MANRRLFVPFTKIDEEKREVAGRLTQEIVDRDEEIWDYDASVPHMRAWSDSFAKATDGKSLGNLRAMHQPISAGKLTAIDYNDAEKAVDIVVKVVDDAEWEKTKEGLYTGFSIGGRVVRSWRDANEPKFKRFEIRPIEASLADLPCVPTATFDYIKVGGLVETRHFNKIKEPSMKPTKFADAANNKFPVETKAQTRVSIAVWGKTAAVREKYSADEQTAIAKALIDAAAEHGIDGLTEKTLAGGEFAKGLYDVSRLADLISSLGWAAESARYEREHEGDDSTVPDELVNAVAALLGTLETMVGEEGDELLRMLGLEVAGAAKTDAAKTVDATNEAAAAAISTTDAVATSATESAAAAAPPTPEAPVAEKVDVADAGWSKAMAKKHLKVLGDMYDHAKVLSKMASDHCEKLAGLIEAGTDAEEADDSEKLATAVVEKITGERAEWEKRAIKAEQDLADKTTAFDELQAKADQLVEASEVLTKALETRKGRLVSVDRERDGRAAFDTSVKTESVAVRTDLKPGEVDRSALHGEFKKSFQSPQIESGVPGQRLKAEAAVP